MKTGKYHYMPRFNHFNVYDESGVKVSEFRTKEEAQKEVRRLNVHEKTLILTVHKKWFDLICSGEKKEEYRKASSWIESRLLNKEYDYVRFKNGYEKNSPCVTVEYKGYAKNTLFGFEKTYSNGNKAPVHTGDYIIYLGNIIEIRHNGKKD